MSSGWAERFFATERVRLRVLERSGVPPPALLLHATSFCAEVWRPVWEAASETGAGDLHALAVDQRGHGRSDAPERAEAYAWNHLAQDLLALAQGLAEGPALLVGHSSGATACLAAAGLRPELVRGLVLVEPVLFERPAPGADTDTFAGSRRLAERSRKRRASFATREAAREGLASRFPYSGFAAPSLDAYLEGGFRDEAGGVALRCDPEHEAWAYEGAAELDIWPLVSRVEAPVLVLQAVARTTHFAALERPREVGGAIGHFLARVAGS